MHFFGLISDLSLLFPQLFHEAITVLFLGALTHVIVYFVVCICYSNVCGSLSVSAENLAKCLMQMERQLLQLEKELETFSSHDDPTDMFFTKMAISFWQAFCSHSGLYSEGFTGFNVYEEAGEELCFPKWGKQYHQSRWTGRTIKPIQITDGFCPLVRKPPQKILYKRKGDNNFKCPKKKKKWGTFSLEIMFYSVVSQMCKLPPH